MASVLGILEARETAARATAVTAATATVPSFAAQPLRDPPPKAEGAIPLTVRFDPSESPETDRWLLELRGSNLHRLGQG